jgi:hypothetical protein
MSYQDFQDLYLSHIHIQKKHFTEKIISKLIVENNQVIQDPKAILTEQKKITRNYMKVPTQGMRSYIMSYS